MNFDQQIDRNQFPTMKWGQNFLQNFYGNADAIPMSVADMDFPAPTAVIQQLQKRAAHGIYGYEYKPDSFFEAFTNWYKTRHNWEIDLQHVEQCPSIMNAISVLIDQHSEAGDGVILQSPVFFEFKGVIRSNGRKLIKNGLVEENGRYTINFNDLEEKASVATTKILILCNPHNPIGRVWTKDELQQIADICLRHNIFVIADEIHGDFAFKPHQYTPFLTVSEEMAQQAAACISPAKTFIQADGFPNKIIG